MRILVIDDERALTASLRHGLLAEGYVVDVAHDGQTGAELGMMHPYQAIILDIMLPGLNGYQVCALLRREGVTCPVLMLTAKSGEYDEAEGLDTGADDYLTKPFSYPVLLARLRALIRRGGAGRVNILGPLKVGDLSVDVYRRECRRQGESIALTSKQFAVLACLARHSGEVVTKAQIVDEVWDMAYDGDFNIVEVYIRALRQRIDVPFGVSTIRTIRGSGYRLVDGND